MRPTEVVPACSSSAIRCARPVPLGLKLRKRCTRGLRLRPRGLKLGGDRSRGGLGGLQRLPQLELLGGQRIGTACGLVARLLQTGQLLGQHITLGLDVAQAGPGRCRVRTRRFQLACQLGRARHGALELSGQRIALGAEGGPLLGQRLRLALDLAQPRGNGRTLTIACGRRIARLAGCRLGRAQLVAQTLDETCQLVALCGDLAPAWPRWSRSGRAPPRAGR